MQIYQVNTNRGLRRKWENLSKTETVLKTDLFPFLPWKWSNFFPNFGYSVSILYFVGYKDTNFVFFHSQLDCANNKMDYYLF